MVNGAEVGAGKGLIADGLTRRTGVIVQVLLVQDHRLRERTVRLNCGDAERVGIEGSD